MSYNCIAVSPVKNGYFGFNVKYCSQRITVPGFECLINEPQKISHHLKKMGCDITQIDIIMKIMNEGRDGIVDKTGEVRDEEYYEDDYEDLDVEDDYEDLDVEDDCEDLDVEDDCEENKEELNKRKEKILSLLRLNTEESLRGIEIYGNVMSRSSIEPVYRDGVRVGTRFEVENIRIDKEIKEQLKEIGLL